jgi:hypothetical protein
MLQIVTFVTFQYFGSIGIWKIMKIGIQFRLIWFINLAQLPDHPIVLLSCQVKKINQIKNKSYFSALLQQAAYYTDDIYLFHVTS